MRVACVSNGIKMCEIYYIFFSILFGVGVLDGFLGLGFSVDGVWGLWCWPSGFLGLGLSI